MSSGWGYPAHASRGRGVDPRMAMWVIIGFAVLAVLVRTHHVTKLEILFFCALVPSVILHEVSHGAMALAFGDDTAKRAGRLTLNPVRHVDPFGTIILPILLTLSGVGTFGYAKPVPVNVSRLRHPRNQGVVVSLVGPGVNIVLALAFGLAYRGPGPVLGEGCHVRDRRPLAPAHLGRTDLRSGLCQRDPRGVQPDPVATAGRFGGRGAPPAS